MRLLFGFIVSTTLFFSGHAYSATAETEKIAGQAGIWQLVANNDPFADQPAACRIQSETVGEQGARRTEARIRINLKDSTVFIDPSIDLKRVIMANRHVIKNRGKGIQSDPNRFLPDNILYHRFRIDQGYILEQSVKDPEFGEWAVHTDIQDFGEAITALSEGDTLFYKWTLENGEQIFQYDLTGFKEMVDLYKQECP